MQSIISISEVRIWCSDGTKEQVFNAIRGGAKEGFTEKVRLELGLGGCIGVCLMVQVR